MPIGKQRTRSCAGFTLLEVLVAVAVIGIALFAIVRATQQTARSTAYLQNKIVADVVANDILARVRTGFIPLPPSGGQKTGNVTILAQNWEWQVKLSSTSEPNIQQITVTIKKNNKDAVSIVAYAPINKQNKLIL